MDDDRILRDRALTRDPTALRALIDRLTPVVHVRVARALERWRSGRGRDRRQEVADIAQEVFVSLFANDARALRAWDPERGASLSTYIGLISEHQVASILRSGRRNPWTEEPMVDPDASAQKDAGPEAQLVARNLFASVLDRIRAELTPRGLDLFYALMVEEQPIDEVCTRTGMTSEAVWAWRSRLARRARELAEDLGNPLSARAVLPRMGNQSGAP
jgi:DNA-directed RNA polymerase specialized sigma24 family protein